MRTVRTARAHEVGGPLADAALLTLRLGTGGLMAGHVAPEAAHGGPIAALREGDIVRFDIGARTLSVDLSDEELAARMATLTPVPPRMSTGVFGKYARLVSSAARGAVT